ncbi:TonB-dependent receptor [Pseudoalteromonas aurantia]|uniref:TonB-dependent receptor n=1 Tax=Pseudoalteromonas aurantia TaxID=43654 RepID=A0ABY2VUI0_9GAMM|nr:TonB-dependent receptor [Pseudoalteromonas aurantia]TMO66714.1 TonB-dependent receptor [Pseudoalteromonas aurantia]TMO71957.1 TonB-dependent receptor [Pseudoalteromonas aurantia]
MNTNRFKRNAITLALITTPIVSHAFEDNIGQADKSLEVITVVGEKVERTLKETLSSTSVITDEELKSGQFLALGDALDDIPNVVVLSGAVPDIRGVTGNGSATGFSSFTGGARARVSTLVDGVEQPFVADRTGDTGLWDIEQIEVFRGPQSTNNGRNSIGGAVYVKTKDASFDFGGAARLGYRNQANYTDAAISITGGLIEDTLAARVSAQLIDGDTNSNIVEHEANSSRYDFNEVKVKNVRTKFLLQPTQKEDFQVRLNYSHNSEKGNVGRKYFAVDDPWQFISIFPRYITTESDTLSLSADYQISDAYSVDVMLSTQDYDWSMDTYEPVAALEQYVEMFNGAESFDTRFNFDLAANELKGFVGLQLEQREQRFVSVGGFPYKGFDDSEYRAIYGEIDIALSEKVHLITGGRYQTESQKRNFIANFFNKAVDELLDKDYSILLPKLAIRYDMSDDTSMFVSARKGYNAGGGALQFTTLEYYYYDEETVNTFEYGIRSSFDKGNTNVSANIFYNDFSGYQGTDSTMKITNIDAAVTQGLELEFNTMLSQTVQLNGGLGLLKSKIKKAGETFTSIICNELNSTPGISANLGVKYWLKDAFTVSASANYVDEYYGDVANTKGRVAGGYTVARVVLDYNIQDFTISAFINNAFNEKEAILNEPAGSFHPDGYTAIVEPRSVGASMTYRF